MNRSKNIEAIFQIMLLIVIAGLILWILISGKVNYYVHPRFRIGLWISVVVLCIFAASLLSGVKRAIHNRSLKKYAVFILPLVLAVTFPATGVSGKSMSLSSNQGVEAESITSTDVSQQAEANSSITNENEENIFSEDDEIDTSLVYDQYEEQGVVRISEAVFTNWYYDIYLNTEDFIGKRYQYLAQVYSVDDFEEDQFLAGRYFMVCCAADVAGYGILCESEERSNLTDDEWILVTGTVETTKYHGETVPVLTDVIIESGDVPDDPYVYYSYY